MSETNEKGIDAVGVEPRRASRRWLRWSAVALVVVAGALWFGVFLPKLRMARLNRNESGAIAALKNISSAQSQLQASGLQDANGNGQGEYGFFGQLSGTVPLRRPAGQEPRLCWPPVLSASFGEVANGRVQVGGYWFEMFLPAADGQWAAERSGQACDTEDSEVFWVCYAYPVERGVTGMRSFMIDQSGDVFASNLSAFAREDRPDPGVSGYQFDEMVPQWLVGARIAANSADVNGNYWVVV